MTDPEHLAHLADLNREHLLADYCTSVLAAAWDGTPTATPATLARFRAAASTTGRPTPMTAQPGWVTSPAQLVWADQPIRDQLPLPAEVVAAIVKRPGVKAKVATFPSRNGAYLVARRQREGRIEGFPPDRWRFTVSRKEPAGRSSLWVCYDPEKGSRP